MDTVDLGTPLIQLGFAGFSLLELAIIVWLVRELIQVLKANNAVLADHNELMRALTTKVGTVEELTGETRDKLLSRPCINRREV
jgi:hypothetical protein